MKVEMIMACDQNGLIGCTKQGHHSLPWHCPSDLQHFKSTTQDYCLVMGRTTWESLGCRLLPGRDHIVVTSHAHTNDEYKAKELLGKGINPKYSKNLQHLGKGNLVFVTIEELEGVMRERNQNYMVSGGCQLYSWFLKRPRLLSIVHVNRIDLKVNDPEIKDLVYAPKLDENIWYLLSQQEHKKGPNDDAGFSACVYGKLSI